MNETTGSLFFWDSLKVLSSAPSSATLKINHGNVLAAAKIIQAQIDALGDRVRQNVRALNVEAPGEDPVSIEAAEAWNYRLMGSDDSYVNRVNDYLQSLEALIQQLRESAMTYKLNENDIAATFGDKRG